MSASVHLIDDDYSVLGKWDIDGTQALIGRYSDDVSHQVPEIGLFDPLVAYAHAKIWQRPDEQPVWFLEDLGRGAGTYVNDSRLRQLHRLRHGDIIKVGNTRLLFEFKEHALA